MTRFLNAVVAFSWLPVRLFVQDEARFGLHESITRRCITAPGVKPHQLVLPRYKYFWLFGATEPATGESFFLEMPALDSDCFQVFIDEFARTNRESMNVLVIDGAPAHIAGSLILPDNVVLFRLPPYCPELNPAERVWQDLRKRLMGGEKIWQDLQSCSPDDTSYCGRAKQHLKTANQSDGEAPRRA